MSDEQSEANLSDDSPTSQSAALNLNNGDDMNIINEQNKVTLDDELPGIDEDDDDTALSTSSSDEANEITEADIKIQEVYKYVNKVYLDQSLLLQTIEKGLTDTFRVQIEKIQDRVLSMEETLSSINGRILNIEEDTLKTLLDP